MSTKYALFALCGSGRIACFDYDSEHERDGCSWNRYYGSHNVMWGTFERVNGGERTDFKLTSNGTAELKAKIEEAIRTGALWYMVPGRK